MKVLVPGALRSYTGRLQVEAEGETLEALFADLEHRYPGLRFRVVDEQGALRPNIRIFVNGLGVRDLRHALQEDDFVAIVLALMKCGNKVCRTLSQGSSTSWNSGFACRALRFLTLPQAPA